MLEKASEGKCHNEAPCQRPLQLFHWMGLTRIWHKAKPSNSLADKMMNDSSTRNMCACTSCESHFYHKKPCSEHITRLEKNVPIFDGPFEFQHAAVWTVAAAVVLALSAAHVGSLCGWNWAKLPGIPGKMPNYLSTGPPSPYPFRHH